VRRPAVVLLLAGAVAAAGTGGWFVRGDAVRTSAPAAEEPGLTVERSMVHPGMIMLFARNDGDEPVRIAQVLVNDAFVDFGAARLTVPPHGRTQVDLRYAWVAGESYELGLLTGSGAIVEYELEDAGTA